MVCLVVAPHVSDVGSDETAQGTRDLSLHRQSRMHLRRVGVQLLVKVEPDAAVLARDILGALRIFWNLV